MREHADVIEEARERLALYNRADRDEAEELYGDYVDAVETGTELLADIRDHFARTLDEGVGRAVRARVQPRGRQAPPGVRARDREPLRVSACAVGL